MKQYAILFIILFHHVCMNAQGKPYEIVINEILADPSPIIGLPNCEFIELRNCSDKNINLDKWRISNGSTTSIITIDHHLKPDSIVILCSKANAIFFNAPHVTVGLTTFPSLGNDEGLLTLSDKTGKTIHAVAYKKSWHENPIKAEGGWSLELINPFRPCDPNNWSSSNNASGGSPGKENSMINVKTAEVSLKALQCIGTNGKTFRLKLNKGSDSISLAALTNYSWESNKENPIMAIPIKPLFNEVELHFQQEIAKEKILRLDLDNIKQCTTDSTEKTSVLTGIPIIPEKGDLIINELLFNPTAYGADFLELYNHSNAVINMKEVFIAGKNSTGQTGTHYRCSEEDHNLFPDQHFVVTTDTAYVNKSWPGTTILALSSIRNMPSFPDDEGIALVTNQQGITIDEFHYKDDMHFPMLIDQEGVSLERIDPDLPTSLAENWHSASSTAGYATPTKKNSQYKHVMNSDLPITIEQKYFSPNNDGLDDVLTIGYHFSSPGNMISITVFDFNGKLINKMINNQLCGTTGSYIWKGLDHNNNKVRSGIYIIFAETLDLKGKTMRFKQAVAVE